MDQFWGLNFIAWVFIQVPVYIPNKYLPYIRQRLKIIKNELLFNTAKNSKRNKLLFKTDAEFTGTVKMHLS